MTNLEVNTHDAKTNLSKYLKKVQQGEVITLCRNGEPIAQIVPLPKKEKRSLIGAAKGLGEVPESFFDEMTDEELPGMGL